jgi:hypothetical protein
MSGEPVLALAVGLGLANSLFHLVYHRVPVYLDPTTAVGDAAAVRLRAPQLATALAGVGAIVAFAAGWWPELAGAVAIVATWRLYRWELGTYPGQLIVQLGKYAPAAATLLGFVVARLLARALGLDADARAWDAAAGVFGGCYVLAGIAKVRGSGWGWGRAEHMSVLLAERGFGRWGALRLRLAQSRAACAAIGWGGLLVELGGVAFVWAPARPGLAVGLVAFKAATWLLFGYFEPEWALVAVAIGLAAAG